MIARTVSSTVLAAAPTAALAEGLRAPQGFGDVGPAFWLIIAAVFCGLLAFMLWGIHARHRDPEQHASTGKYHAAGALVIVMTLFTLVLYITVAARLQQMEPTETAWDWQPGEEVTDPAGSGMTGEPYRGYQLYTSQGCVYCHTQYIREEDIPTGWAAGAKKADVTEPGDFVEYPYTLLGTQRNGPDLTIVGRRLSDMQYHVEHFKHPRQFKPQSIMPSYAHLSEEDLKDLAAYMISLGNPPDALRADEVGADAGGEGGLAEAGELAQKGKQLFNSEGCIGCHSVDGSSNVGPTMSGRFGSEVQLKSGETVVADADHIRDSIVNPQAKLAQGYPPVMPNRYGNLSDKELDALVAYIEFLGDGEGS